MLSDAAARGADCLRFSHQINKQPAELGNEFVSRRGLYRVHRNHFLNSDFTNGVSRVRLN